MYLKELHIHCLRNFREATLHLSPQFNLFVGKNGSGKTSLLESVYLLATGQSFRTHHAQDFIQNEQPQCCVRGQVSRLNSDDGLGQPLNIWRVGIQRDRLGGRELRINEEICRTRAELAKLLPIQIMNTASYQLFNLPPKHRRAFLDWGVFHVEPAFASLWARYQRALNQRNAAIKRVKTEGLQLVTAWEAELVETGESIHALRTQFIEDFTPIFQSHLATLLPIPSSALSYYSGWPNRLNLEAALIESRERDIALGYTTTGPHRADFAAKLSGISVEILLSRGQLKLFLAALMLARQAWLFKRKGCRSVFLLDDLSSELDKEARLLLLQSLQQMGGQVWITAIEHEKAFNEVVKEGDTHMFHVERGRVQTNATPI